MRLYNGRELYNTRHVLRQKRQENLPLGVLPHSQYATLQYLVSKRGLHLHCRARGPSHSGSSDPSEGLIDTVAVK